MTEKLLPSLFLALLLVFLQLRSGASSDLLLVVGATAAFAYVLIASGRLVHVATRGTESNPAIEYVLGLLASCLCVYGLTLLLPLTAVGALGIVAVVVVGLEIALARRLRRRSTNPHVLIGFALCALFTAAWCNGPASAYEIMRTQGIYPAWTDYFFHGSIISQFGDVRAAGRQSILLADFPSSFYHFASYADAAALAGVLDQPGLPLATSVWLPLGFLAMTAGAYALGERLAGAAGGLAALAAVAILPDASNYGLRNGLMSFHWSVLAHPGATYALGAAFLSMTFLDRWSSGRSIVLLAASAGLAASTFLFRAHIFLLYFPAWIAAVLYSNAPERRRRSVALLLIGGLGMAALAASFLLTQFAQSGLPSHWRLGEPALGRFLNELHLHQEPTAYTGLYPDLAIEGPSSIILGVGVLLAVCAALGAFLILLPCAAGLAGRRGVLRSIDSVPAYVAYCWLLLVLLAPLTAPGPATDLIERPIVLVYACVAIWTPCLLLRCLDTGIPQKTARSRNALLAGSLLALPGILIGAESMARPKFAWGEPHISHRVELGLVEAAAFLRSRARVGDIFASTSSSTSFVTFDFPMKLASLSGVPAYLSRPRLEMLKDGPRKELVMQRVAALEAIEKQDRYDDAMRLLQRLPVHWYVATGVQGPNWDPQRERAAFAAGTVAVYATGR